MNLKEFYAAIGGDYADVIKRLQCESLIEQFLYKFIDDPSYGELKNALALGDISSAFRAAHTLKGLAATFGFKRLTESSSVITEYLRSGNSLPPSSLIANVDNDYNAIVSELEKTK